MLGGIGIFAGLSHRVLGRGRGRRGALRAASSWRSSAAARSSSSPGLLDDLFSLGPIPKLAAQIAAAVLVISNGLTISGLISNDFLRRRRRTHLARRDDERVQPARQHGRACGDARRDRAPRSSRSTRVTVHKSDAVLASVARARVACAGFLPFNLRPRQAARGLHGRLRQPGARLRCSQRSASTASWKVAGTTVATLLLPILVLAVPILDTTLVTVVRLLDGRPVYQGGRDHTSHRLVYHGLSEKRAVVLLAVISASARSDEPRSTAVLDNAWVTLIGVLLTFALLVQFASVLSRRRTRPGLAARPRLVCAPSSSNPRRLVEVARRLRADHRLVRASAYYHPRCRAAVAPYQRHIFAVSLAGRCSPHATWRSSRSGSTAASGATPAHATPRASSRRSSSRRSSRTCILDATQTWGRFPREHRSSSTRSLCIAADRRLALLGACASCAASRRSPAATERRRTLIVGAGRGGRSLLRELRETRRRAGRRLRRRRSAAVAGAGCRASRCSATPDEIEQILLEASARTPCSSRSPTRRASGSALVVDACASAQVPCRFVRRETDLDPARRHSARPSTDPSDGRRDARARAPAEQDAGRPAAGGGAAAQHLPLALRSST
mgnify:CR=1 FL=1